MKQLTKLKCDYCSWCEVPKYKCKNNKAKCHKYSKRLINKRFRKMCGGSNEKV